jgi:hypothetical protein
MLGLGLGDATPDKLAANQIKRHPRAHRHRNAERPQRKMVVGHTPMPLEALRRYSGPDGVPVGQPLSESRIVTIQQGSWVGVQGVDLDETWYWHLEGSAVRTKRNG